MKRIRIVSKDGSLESTTVIDLDSGEEFENIIGVEIRIHNGNSWRKTGCSDVAIWFSDTDLPITIDMKDVEFDMRTEGGCESYDTPLCLDDPYKPCPECGDKGFVELATSREPCRACKTIENSVGKFAKDIIDKYYPQEEKSTPGGFFCNEQAVRITASQILYYRKGMESIDVFDIDDAINENMSAFMGCVTRTDMHEIVAKVAEGLQVDAETNREGIGLFSGDAADVANWDGSNSTPLEDLKAGIKIIEESVGYSPNVVVHGEPTCRCIHADNGKLELAIDVKDDICPLKYVGHYKETIAKDAVRIGRSAGPLDLYFPIEQGHSFVVGEKVYINCYGKAVSKLNTIAKLGDYCLICSKQTMSSKFCVDCTSKRKTQARDTARDNVRNGNAQVGDTVGMDFGDGMVIKAEIISWDKKSDYITVKCTVEVDGKAEGNLLVKCSNKYNNSAKFGESFEKGDSYEWPHGSAPQVADDQGASSATCDECYGTGFQMGFGAPCTKGCKAK